VHTTTNNIVDLVCSAPPGQLVSFDIDPVHIEFARDFCKSDRLRLIEGDSVKSMAAFFRDTRFTIDLLCLDSKEFDEDHMVNEYRAVEHRLATDHYVLVDDIHNPSSVKYKKMVPLLKSLGYEFVEVPTPTGLFFAARGLPLPNG